MQLTLFYTGGLFQTYFRALETLSPREEDMADDDDEAFDDEMQDEEDFHQLRTNDPDRELDPEDDDHLPDEDLQ
ncbi:hypothetical protein [Mucilaginibacter terrae]|uniref:DNA primase n=1 Tax=Mucilaginibacter terrae TaxID=1955052 RepID=A0ABU3GW06_9SPHI|nr:hypothetical protein [Mucilaginibacter terrae]MDT3403959.1 hypothetical protein [Mucilaginibacter terrae]